MKISGKTIIIFCLLSFVFLFALPFLGKQGTVLASTCGSSVAQLKCKLTNALASGESVTCDMNTVASCTKCTDGVKSGSCTISGGESSCTVNSIDCACSPFYVQWSWDVNGEYSFNDFVGDCDYAYYGYPVHNGTWGADWVYLWNPYTCTIKYNYTPASVCTHSAPGAPTNLSPNGQTFCSTSITASWSTNSTRNCSNCANCTDNFYAEVWKDGGSVFQTMAWTSTNSWTINANQGPGTYYWHVRQGNGYDGSGWSQGSFVVSPNQSPNNVQTYINSASVLANGTTQYSITVSAWDPDGGGDVRNTYALINYQGANAGQYRGYIGWTAYQSNYPYWGSGFSQQVFCSGAGGWAAKYNDYGPSYLELVSCWSTVNPNNYKMLQVYFTVKFNTNFTSPATGNIISGWVMDKTCGAVFDWTQGASFSLTTPRSWTINAQARCGNGTGPIANNHVTRMWGVDGDASPWSSWVDSSAIGTHSKYLTTRYDSSYQWIGMDDGTGSGNLNLSDASPPSGITKATFGSAPVYRWQKTDLAAGTYSLDFKAPSNSWCRFGLSVSKAGNGSGTVTSSPAGINCGSTCSADYDYNTSVTLTASASTGFSFSGWSGDCNSSGQVTMTSAKSCTATFNDTTAPTGTISINSAAAYTNTTSTTLTLTCADAGSGCSKMKFSNNNSTWSAEETSAASKSWTLTTGNGTKTVYVKYKDTAGNWSGSYSDTIILDATAPTGTISINSGATYTNTTSATLTLTCADSGSGCSKMKFSNNNSTWSAEETSAASKSWTLTTGDGTKTVYVKYKDAIGNWSGSYSDTIILDATAPSGTFTPNSQSWTKNNVSVVFNPSDTGGSGVYRWRYKTSLNGGITWGSWSSYIIGDTNGTITLNATGNWQINSQVIDNANNTNSAIYSGFYQIDKINPVVTIFDVQPRITASLITISWTVTDSGGSYLKQAETWRANYNSSNCSETDKSGCVWSQIGSAYSAPSSSNSWNSSATNTLSAGSYWYGLHVLDNATNLGTESSPIKIIVNQPPIANFSCTPTSCMIYTGENLTFNNTSSDPNNNLARSEWDILNWGSAPDLTCCASGCNSSTILCNYTTQFLGRGNYQTKLTVKDAFNETNSLTKNFVIKQDAIADFVCSRDNINWQACNSVDFRPSQGITIYFHDNLSDAILTQFGLTGRRSTPSEGASISQRVWKKNNVTFNSGNNSSPSLEMTDAEADISLQITDTASRSASVSFHVIAGAPLPEWEEIIPITWKVIKERLAGLIFFWR